MRNGFFVVDAHAHIAHEDEMRGIPPALRNYQFTAEQMIARMDQCGIDLSVVIAHAYGGWRMDQYRKEHDVIMKDIKRYPGRMIGYCWVDPHFGAEAMEELERCVKELGYVGMKFHPIRQQFFLDSPIVNPFVEKAAELGLPVMVHVDRWVDGGSTWRLINLARRFPEVTFFMGHMGHENVFSMVPAEIATQASNVILESSCTTTDPWGTFTGPALLLGPERVVFGSDGGAFMHPAVNLLKIDLAGLDDRSKRLILGENMLTLHKLDAKELQMAARQSKN
jgi:uncharacterized protein